MWILSFKHLKQDHSMNTVAVLYNDTATLKFKFCIPTLPNPLKWQRYISTRDL